MLLLTAVKFFGDNIIANKEHQITLPAAESDSFGSLLTSQHPLSHLISLHGIIPPQRILSSNTYFPPKVSFKPTGSSPIPGTHLNLLKTTRLP